MQDHRLVTLGGLDLHRVPDRSLSAIVTQPKRLALLVYLTVNRPVVRRDKLLAVFWPESDTARARRALNQAIHVLRAGTGAGTLVTRGGEDVTVDRGSMACDAVEFEESLRAGRRSDGLELYRGPLLDGFHLEGAPLFTEWMESERRRLHDLAVGAARAEGKEAARAGDVARALDLAQRAARWCHALDEGAVRCLVEAHHRAGDRVEALRIFEDFARRLLVEYDSLPAPETQSLMASLRSSGHPRAAIGAVDAPEPPAMPPAHTRTPTKVVGERLALARVVAAAWAQRRDRRASPEGTGPHLISVFPFAYEGAPVHAHLGEAVTRLLAANLHGLQTRSSLGGGGNPAGAHPGRGPIEGRYAVCGEVAETGGRLCLRAWIITAADPHGREVSIDGDVDDPFGVVDRATVRLLAEIDFGDGPSLQNNARGMH
jgi:DNA-binding SARP family transcriptional activator